MGFFRKLGRAIRRAVKVVKRVVKRVAVYAVTAVVAVATSGASLAVVAGRMAIAHVVSTACRKLDRSGVLGRIAAVAATWVDGGQSLASFQRAMVDQVSAEVQTQALKRMDVDPVLKAAIAGGMGAVAGRAADKAAPIKHGSHPGAVMMLRAAAGEGAGAVLTGSVPIELRGAIGVTRSVVEGRIDPNLIRDVAGHIVDAIVEHQPEILAAREQAQDPDAEVPDGATTSPPSHRDGDDGTSAASGAGTGTGTGTGAGSDGVGALDRLDAMLGFGTGSQERLSLRELRERVPDHEDKAAIADLSYGFDNVRKLRATLGKLDAKATLQHVDSDVVVYTTTAANGTKQVVASVRGLDHFSDVLDIFSIAARGSAVRNERVEAKIKAVLARHPGHAVVVSGHSMGGAISVDLARANPTWTCNAINPGSPGVMHMVTGGTTVSAPPPNAMVVFSGDDFVSTQWSAHQDLPNVVNVKLDGELHPHRLGNYLKREGGAAAGAGGRTTLRGAMRTDPFFAMVDLRKLDVDDGGSDDGEDMGGSGGGGGSGGADEAKSGEGGDGGAAAGGGVDGGAVAPGCVDGGAVELVAVEAGGGGGAAAGDGAGGGGEPALGVRRRARVGVGDARGADDLADLL